MSTDEFIHIWQAYDAKLEKSIQLNFRLLKDMQTQKARSTLHALILPRVISIALGLLWEVVLGVVLYHVWSQVVMAISIGVFVLCTGFAIVDCICDIVIIRRICYVDNIVETQGRMAALQRSMIRTIRLMWLQLPFWTTFFVGNEMLRSGGAGFWLIQVPVTALFIFLTVFLYRNIIPENMAEKKWVRAFVNGSGARTVERAMGFVREIEEFKKGG